MNATQVPLAELISALYRAAQFAPKIATRAAPPAAWLLAASSGKVTTDDIDAARHPTAQR